MPTIIEVNTMHAIQHLATIANEILAELKKLNSALEKKNETKQEE